MKKIVCEMCDSSNFLKQDGMFVCQECGSKYTVEEARKLMVEVDGDVSAAAAPGAPAVPAAPDNSQKIENLRKLAKRAKEEDNSQMAAKYYEQLLLECPDDWEASFYSTYYAAHNIKIAQIGSAANRVANIIGPTFKLIKQTCNEADGTVAYIRVATDVISFNNMLFSNITPNLGSNMDIVKRNIDNWMVPTVSMLVILGDKLRLEFPGEATDTLALQIYNSAFNYTKTSNSFTTAAANLHRNVVNRKNQLEAEEKARKERKQREAREAYWAAHAEEKAKLLEERDDCKARINNLNLQIAQAKEAAGKEEASLQARINDLVNQKSALGLFKGKEKKALQEQIDGLHSQMTQLRTRTQETISKLTSQMQAPNTRISEIDKELNRDR